MARLLNLNETQSGVLHLVFKIADDNGMLLLNLKDLRAMLQHVGDNAAQFKLSTATSQRPALARSSAGCWNSKGSAAIASSVSMRSIWTIFFRRTVAVAA